MSSKDGFRVRIDRLCPGGIKKDNAKIDLLLKEIAPNNELRKWYSHDPDKWKEFKSKYFKGLDGKKDLINELIKKAVKQKLTLLYSSKEECLNNAVIL